MLIVTQIWFNGTAGALNLDWALP